MVSIIAGGCVDPADNLGLVASLAEPVPGGPVVAARELALTTAVPTTLRLTVDGPSAHPALWFATPAIARTLPVLGFEPGAENVVTAEVTDPASGEAASISWTIAAAPLPAIFPEVEVLAGDDAVEPGWTLLDVKSPDSVGYLVMFDEAWRPVWWWDSDVEFGDCRPATGEGLWCLGSGQAWAIDLLGGTHTVWGAEGGAAERVVGLPWSGLSHELLPFEDGFVSIHAVPLDVPLYPADEATPEVLTPARIADTRVVSFADDGAVRRDLAMSTLLDPQRIGFDSLDTTDEGYDWAHGNGLVVDPSGALIVSLRHQDALVSVGEDDAPQWILGTPSGWVEPWASMRLTPVGSPFSWPFHPHAPALTEGGVLYMFDNQFRGYTPYDVPVEESPSRAVGYRVDAAARTVEQVFAFSETATGPLFSSALGDVDVLPATGNVFVDFGFLTGESGVDNLDRGWGLRSVRLVEWDESGAVLADVRLRSDASRVPSGWKTYRAERWSPWAVYGGVWDEP